MTSHTPATDGGISRFFLPKKRRSPAVDDTEEDPRQLNHSSGIDSEGTRFKPQKRDRSGRSSADAIEIEDAAAANDVKLRSSTCNDTDSERGDRRIDQSRSWPAGSNPLESRHRKASDENIYVGSAKRSAKNATEQPQRTPFLHSCAPSSDVSGDSHPNTVTPESAICINDDYPRDSGCASNFDGVGMGSAVESDLREERTTSLANPFAEFAFSAESINRSEHVASATGKGSRKSNSSAYSGDKKLSEEKGSGKTKTLTSRGFTRITDLSMEERMRILSKWQSLADPTADLEVRRFQVLVAARLHARSQEPVVRAAMQSLRAFFSSDPTCSEKGGLMPGSNQNTCPPCQGLCVESLAQADPQEVAKVISSVLFANTKARQIVQAAKDVRSMFGGKVPENENSLKQITGIGPMLSDLLAYVNKRAAYSKAEDEEDNKAAVLPERTEC